MKTITLQVPEGAEPGDILTFVIEGQEMDLPVPAGAEPGDMFEIEVDDGSSNNVDDDVALSSDERKEGNSTVGNDAITTVCLGEGRNLEVCSKLPNDLQDNDGDCKDQDNDGDCKDHYSNRPPEDNEHDGTFELPWRSGIEFARRMNQIYLDYAPQRVLELGSGMGIVGMSFASVQNLSKDATIDLTDLPSAMRLLEYNIEKNKSLFLHHKIQARPLRWTVEGNDSGHDNAIAISDQPYDCIIGSDLLYNAESIPALVATIKRMLHPSRGFVLLAVRWRKPELERQFFRDTGLSWTLLHSHNLSCHLDWENIGDPSNSKSNLYFYQTQISVNGKPKSLADITEEETKHFTTIEFEAWERAHIQMYIGRRLCYFHQDEETIPPRLRN